MIERLLAADAALAREELDTAEKLFGQVAEADPRNAIAAVGLGRVAAGRDDADGARTWFRRALEIDPDEAAAHRLLDALDRVAPEIPSAPPASPRPAAAEAPEATDAPIPRPASRSLLSRIRSWFGLGG